MHRSAFLAGALVLLAAPCSAAVAAESADLRLSTADMQQIAQTVQRTRVVRVWKPASALPQFAPLALPKRRTRADGDAAVVWINADHRELMTPRASHPEDEDPIVTAVIAGTLDLNLDEPGWKHLSAVLEHMPAGSQYPVIAQIGTLLVSRFAVRTTPGVSDEEFAREAFPFAVIRNMTPGIPGVDVDGPPAGTVMPKDAPLIAYVGRTDPRHPGTPVVWGDEKHMPANFTQSLEFGTLYMRAYILATADMQPPDSPEKRAYDAARTADESAGPGTYTARYAFAAPYIPRVRALASH